MLVMHSNVFAGRCTGSSNCRACSTCSSCRYCNGGGGTCGICGGGSSSGFIGKIIIGVIVIGVIYSIANSDKKK